MQWRRETSMRETGGTLGNAVPDSLWHNRRRLREIP